MPGTVLLALGQNQHKHWHSSMDMEAAVRLTDSMQNCGLKEHRLPHTAVISTFTYTKTMHPLLLSSRKPGHWAHHQCLAHAEHIPVTHSAILVQSLLLLSAGHPFLSPCWSSPVGLQTCPDLFHLKIKISLDPHPLTPFFSPSL